MSKKSEVLTFVFLLGLALSCIVFAGTHTPWDGTKWDVASPDIDQPHGNAYKEIYDLRKGIAIRMNKEHVTLATSSAGGEHKQGSAVAWHLATASIPALQPDGTALAATDNGRLWHDITTDIFYVLDDYSDPTVDGGWIPMGHYLGDIAINTDKFTVARATGNTVIAGTCDITGATEVTGVATLGDASLLKTSAAPTTDAMIANKKYVDDTVETEIDGDVPTNLDSESNAMVKEHAYLAQTSGFVNVYENGGVGNSLAGYVGTTTDPYIAGTRIAFEEASDASDAMSISFFVANGKYFEVRGGDLLGLYWTPLTSGGAAPVDHN